MLNRSANIVNRVVAWARDHVPEHHKAVAAMTPGERVAFADRANVF